MNEMKRWKNEKKNSIHISYEKNLNNIFSSFFEWMPIWTRRILLCGSFLVGDLIFGFLIARCVLYAGFMWKIIFISFWYFVLIRTGQRIMQTCPTSSNDTSQMRMDAAIMFELQTIKQPIWVSNCFAFLVCLWRKLKPEHMYLDRLLPFQLHHSRYGTSSNLDYSRCNK